MKIGKYKLRDKYGYPVVSIKDKPITNIIRAVKHTNIYKTVSHKDDIKKFTISVKMSERWIPSFISMLKYMEHLGNIGSSKTVSFYSDGDGDFRPVFSVNIKYETSDSKGDDCGNKLYDAG